MIITIHTQDLILNHYMAAPLPKDTMQVGWGGVSPRGMQNERKYFTVNN